MRKAAEFHRIHAQGRSHQLRRRVALEAARLISEHGIRDYRQAKLKAAQRLGLDDEQQLPRNREIEEALREHQNNKTASAKALGITREGLHKKLRGFGL